jgi:hypothetical protein
MIGFEDIITESVKIGNVTYIIKSCCDGEYLCINIRPSFDESTLNWMLEEQEIDRPIIDGKVDWFSSDYGDPILVKLMPVAEDIANKTDKLMRRIWKMKVFS